MKANRIYRLSQLARHFWKRACEKDSIPAASSFVIFDDNNEYIIAYNRALSLRHRLICQ